MSTNYLPDERPKQSAITGASSYQITVKHLKQTDKVQFKRSTLPSVGGTAKSPPFASNKSTEQIDSTPALKSMMVSQMPEKKSLIVGGNAG